MELFQSNQRHMLIHLLSIFEHVNHVRIVLRTIKAEDGDCDGFYRQVKVKALFLFVFIEKEEYIPPMTEGTPLLAIELPSPKPPQF